MTKEVILANTKFCYTNETQEQIALLAMQQYADQQCLERDERIKKLEEALKIIGKISDHGIPYYAIGDSEAADTLNSLLQQVSLIVGQTLFSESKP